VISHACRRRPSTRHSSTFAATRPQRAQHRNCPAPPTPTTHAAFDATTARHYHSQLLTHAAFDAPVGSRGRFWAPEPQVGPTEERKQTRERSFRLGALGTAANASDAAGRDAQPYHVESSPQHTNASPESSADIGVQLRTSERFVLKQIHFDYVSTPWLQPGTRTRRDADRALRSRRDMDSFTIPLTSTPTAARHGRLSRTPPLHRTPPPCTTPPLASSESILHRARPHAPPPATPSPQRHRRQFVAIDFSSSDFRFTTCGTPVDGGPDSFIGNGSLHELLPPNGDLELDPSCRGLALRTPPSGGRSDEYAARGVGYWRSSHSFAATHPIDGGCRLVVCLRRRPSAFILSFLLPSALVTLSTIASLIILPIRADLATSRASVLLVAMLLLVETDSAVWRGGFNVPPSGGPTLLVRRPTAADRSALESL
jgi:hypothetical protein